MASDMRFSLEVLGSGTSSGVPIPGCNCSVCTSEDPRDARLRQSALLRFANGIIILIDCGTDTRAALLRTEVQAVDAVLVTHSHADHIHGLCDLEPFAKQRQIPVYVDSNALSKLQNTFEFLFHGGMEADGLFELRMLQETNVVHGIEVVRVPLKHGILDVSGFRIGNLAYLTDVSDIPQESYQLLSGVEYLFIDGLSLKIHPSHFSFEDALIEIEKIQPKYAWLIHISDSAKHTEIEDFINEQIKSWPKLANIKIHPAFDGLKVEKLHCSIDSAKD